jgi:hypothetical protein
MRDSLRENLSCLPGAVGLPLGKIDHRLLGPAQIKRRAATALDDLLRRLALVVQLPMAPGIFIRRVDDRDGRRTDSSLQARQYTGTGITVIAGVAIVAGKADQANAISPA